jgi:RimJ/RimL family protein N-acetyltransferase
MATEYEKFFPAGFTLETPRVILRLLKAEDHDALLPLTQSDDIWKFFTKYLSQPGELKTWIEDALKEREEQKKMPFLVIDKPNQICGSTSFGNISFYDKRIEIGWTWLGQEFIGIGINRQAKFALLSYAFEVMQMERVEIKTDILNERARAALLKIGMMPEGVLRSHQLMHSNRRRDTIYYSIIKNEWEEKKKLFFNDLVL